MKEKVILGVAFEKNWRKIRANVTLQKIIGENRDNFELIRRNVQGKSPSRRAGGTAGRGARQACRIRCLAMVNTMGCGTVHDIVPIESEKTRREIRENNFGHIFLVFIRSL